MYNLFLTSYFIISKTLHHLIEQFSFNIARILIILYVNSSSLVYNLSLASDFISSKTLHYLIEHFSFNIAHSKPILNNHFWNFSIENHFWLLPSPSKTFFCYFHRIFNYIVPLIEGKTRRRICVTCITWNLT